MTYPTAADRIKARIARWESVGAVNPDCAFCQAHVYPALRENEEPFMPPHTASFRCESGGKPHCGCAICLR